MNNPIFSDVIIFTLDKEPIISKVDKAKWQLNVKNEENWKVIGASEVLKTCCLKYEQIFSQLLVEKKKDDATIANDDKEEESLSIALQILCENLKQRIQYLFNFIMNYRSRFSHQLKTKSTKFLIEEH